MWILCEIRTSNTLISHGVWSGHINHSFQRLCEWAEYLIRQRACADWSWSALFAYDPFCMVRPIDMLNFSTSRKHIFNNLKRNSSVNRFSKTWMIVKRCHRARKGLNSCKPYRAVPSGLIWRKIRLCKRYTNFTPDKPWLNYANDLLIKTKALNQTTSIIDKPSLPFFLDRPNYLIAVLKRRHTCTNTCTNVA